MAPWSHAEMLKGAKLPHLRKQQRKVPAFRKVRMGSHKAAGDAIADPRAKMH
jgi:hypothetical protein